MKNLYVVFGAMGVGKSAACRSLQRRLENCVFLDGDWCWDMDPFQNTPCTRAMVLDNIAFVLNNFLRCEAFSNVVFCWVLPRREVLQEVLSRLEPGAWSLRLVRLTCAPEALSARIRADVDAGLRKIDVLERALSYLPLYRDMPGLCVDNTALTPEQTARRIADAPPCENLFASRP